MSPYLPWTRLTGLALVPLFLGVLAWAGDDASPPAAEIAATTLNAVPSIADQQAVDKTLKEILGPIPPAKLDQYPALAAKLLEQGSDVNAKPEERYVLLLHAAELSADASETATLLRAIQQLDANFSGDRLAWKLDLVRKAVASPLARAKAAALEDACLTLADASALDDDYDSAIKFAGMGQSLARRVNDNGVVNSAGAKIAEYRACQAEYGPAEAAMQKLSSDPHDPISNLACGRYACFVKADWKNGLPMLALGSDPILKALAGKELKDPAEPDAQVEIGNGWWDLSQTKPEPIKSTLRDRATMWYQKAMPRLAGLNKELVKRRLAEQPSTAPSGNPHDLARAGGADDLNAQLNDPKFWTPATGSWTRARNGAMLGSDNGGTTFSKDLPADLTLGFRLTVRGGANPRMVFGPIIFTINTNGNVGFHTLEFVFSGPDYRLLIDGRLATSGRRIPGPMSLALYSGEAGTSAFWDFRAKAGPAPAK